MTPASDDQLAAVLDEIAEMERRKGFEGPKITGYISSVATMQDLMVRGGGDFMPKVIEDAAVGEIGRACDERGWRTSNSGPYLICGGKIYMANIEKRGGLTKASELLAATEGPTLALAAATAYRDALKEMM